MAKHKKRYLDFTHELCEQAVLDAYNDKWLRSDFLLTAGKYSGVSKSEIIRQRKTGAVWYQLEIANGIACEMEERIEALVSGEADDLDLDPVISEQRYDTMANKYREISRCCPLHLCFAHLAVKALMPLLRARITPFQHASIPKRGQTACKRQVERFLRRKALRITHAKKLDVKKAYPSTKAEIIMAILENEIPKAKALLLLVKALLSMSPNGGLIIGGYLEAWLFNLVMSYVIRYILSLKKYKRGEAVPLVKKCAAYMDDTMLLGSRMADLRSAARKSGVYMKDKYGLTWKEKSEEISLLSISEEHERKKGLTPAARGCPGIDIAGFIIHRTYTKIRKRIFLRARRQLIRTAACFITIKFRCCRIIAYHGFFKETNSAKAAKKYNEKRLLAIARKTVSLINQSKEEHITWVLSQQHLTPALSR